MPTKAQAKTAINTAATDAAADIDNILPTGVNISDGGISPNPERYTIMLDAGGNVATALSWFNSVQTNLTNAGRTSFTTSRTDRRSDDSGKRQLVVKEIKLTVVIFNF